MRNRQLVRGVRRFAIAAFGSALLCGIAPVARSQGYPPSVLPLPPEAIAESIAVFRRLDAAVTKNRNDADAWYHRGMIAWLLAEQDRQGVPLPGIPRLGNRLAADTSFKIAVSIERRPRFLLTIGQFRMGRGFLSLQRFHGYRLFEQALDASRASGDRAVLAETAIELGRVYWRRYDAVANRRIETETGVVLRSLTSALQPDGGAMRLSPSTVRYHVHNNTQAVDETGDVDYYQAENLFREAYRANPDDPRTFRQLAMLLAERDRWPELNGFARERTVTHAADPWGWMSLGLALRRRGELVTASAAFDSALARFDVVERGRLYRPELVMREKEAARFVSLRGEDRRRADATFWLFADPLWSRDGSDARTEFLARVAFAELRWTVEEFGVRGLDSDRGHIHVRFGPPDLKMQIWPPPGADDIAEMAARRPTNTQSDAVAMDELTRFNSYTPTEDPDVDTDATRSVVTIWAYDNGMLFFFRGSPTYATSYLAHTDRWQVDTLVERTPARWANVAGVSIEPMPTVISRFRHGSDSAAIVIAVETPVSRIREETTQNTRVRADFWLVDGDAISVHDTGLVAQDAHAWTYRVPSGLYAYRAEVTSDAAMIAGRSGNWILAAPAADSGFAMRGFGMSDVLLGRGGDPAASPPRRWSDAEVAPTAGAIEAGSDVALVWENYEFGARDGTAQYDVTVTIEREYALLVNRIRARIVGGAANLLGIDRVEGRVVVRYEREVAHAPVLVDHVLLSMDGVPAGDYKLTIAVRDRTSGQTTSRVRHIAVRQ